MAKRRTSNVQRRERASTDALNRRLDERGGASLPDWRLLLIGGVLLIGLVILGLVFLFSSGPNPNEGETQPNDGQTHVSPGASCRDNPASCGGLTSNPYSSTPATSGPHWDPSALANWGVYETPQNETQLVHNLEHGGIVIWYQPDMLEESEVQALEDYVNRQVAQGISGRFKFILTPWSGEDFGAPIAVTAWRNLLYLDEVDTAAIDDFARAHYGLAPEPNGGPGPPAT